MRRIAMLVVVWSLGCGEQLGAADWDASPICSILPPCAAGLDIVVARVEPLREPAYRVAIETDLMRHEWSCGPTGCMAEMSSDDAYELAALELADDSGIAFAASLVRLWPPPRVTGPDEVRLLVTQGAGTLVDTRFEPEYRVTHEDDCRVCEHAEVELQ